MHEDCVGLFSGLPAPHTYLSLSMDNVTYIGVRKMSQLLTPHGDDTVSHSGIIGTRRSHVGLM